jgi:hypothetical protein
VVCRVDGEKAAAVALRWLKFDNGIARRQVDLLAAELKSGCSHAEKSSGGIGQAHTRQRLRAKAVDAMHLAMATSRTATQRAPGELLVAVAVIGLGSTAGVRSLSEQLATAIEPGVAVAVAEQPIVANALQAFAGRFCSYGCCEDRIYAVLTAVSPCLREGCPRDHTRETHMGALRKQMDADMVVRGMSVRTRESYLAAVAGLAKYYVAVRSK